jgi:PepSY-associated TM region
VTTALFLPRTTHSLCAFLKRSLIFVHRWLGVALCLVFLLWFCSGIVMMYWDFPNVGTRDRLEHSPPLDGSQIRLSPAEAYAKLESSQPPNQLRLNTFDGRPVYRFRTGGEQRLIYADTGEEQIVTSPEMMQRVAAQWTGQSAGLAKAELLEDVDQWTLEGGLGNLPLWKYSWPDGQQVYISEGGGEVVQYTTRASRFWAYLGAIPHWLYFTPLRKHGPQWSQTVIWVSAVGTVSALLGIVIGVWMYSPAKRYRHAGAPTSIPYRGQKRWHMILGLVFGLSAATWAFSGFLSMDPFPTQTEVRGRGAAGKISSALRGKFQLAAFDSKPPQRALAQLAGLKVKELEFTSFAGEPVYLATLDRGETRILSVRGEPMAAFDDGRVMEILRSAVGPAAIADLRLLNQYDAYYLDRHHEQPLPVIFLKLNDPENTRYYIDPKTARVVGDYRTGRWVERWLYHGLHSLNFPWLYRYRPLWDVVVISLLAGGCALCVTSLMLAWRVVLGGFR